MKITKDINKIIVRKIVEIVFVFAFVLYAGHLWNSENTQEFLTTIATFSNANYVDFSVDNSMNYVMFPMTDEQATKSINPCIIHVNNGTYTLQDYTLVLKIDKTSTMDYHYLNISINGTIYHLNTLETIEDDNEFIFILDKNNIVAETKDYAIQLWLSSIAGNEMQGKNLTMNFDLIYETTQV